MMTPGSLLGKLAAGQRSIEEAGVLFIDDGVKLVVSKKEKTS